jgi:hypothetical protein
MSNDHESNVATTYLALRLGMTLLLGLLGVSVASHALFVATCYPLSISAYYYTPAGPVFTAALVAIGACLIVYRGNTDHENVVLDFCGFFAFVVGFVPTAPDCGSVEAPDIASTVTNNISALFVIGLAATAVGWKMRKSKLRIGGPSKYAKRWFFVALAALVVGLVYFFTDQARFRENGHGIAAGALFVCIVGVVLLNAWGFAREQVRLRNEARSRQHTAFKAATNRYGIVAWLMLASFGFLTVFGHFLDLYDHWFLALEAALIGLFAVFWVFQTFELRGQVSRSQPDESQPNLQDGQRLA